MSFAKLRMCLSSQWWNLLICNDCVKKGEEREMPMETPTSVTPSSRARKKFFTEWNKKREVNRGGTETCKGQEASAESLGMAEISPMSDLGH